MAFRDRLLNSWQEANTLTALLWPLSLIYRLAFFIRAKLYAFGFFQSYKATVPVIVVGNLTVGGTGKTPLVIHLVDVLRANGFTPGVISRGYSGSAQDYPLFVADDTSPVESGDEPALIVRRTGVPMSVGSDRKASIELLLEEASVDVIISDDGLQHLALDRDIEVCLIDETVDSNNTHVLPAGPYREPLTRLGSVDLVVRHRQRLNAIEGRDNGEYDEKSFDMCLKAGEPKQVCQANDELNNKLDVTKPLHAVAGIGNPKRFFSTCDQLGMDFDEYSFPDHYQFEAQDFAFDDEKAILMTEKDAVKCTQFANDKLWFLPVDANLSDGFSDLLLDLLKEKLTR